MRTRIAWLSAFVLLLVGQVFYAQVSGVVNDSDGFPDAGATVAVEGKNISTTTDEDGAFTIDAVVGEDTLVIFPTDGSASWSIPVSSSNLGDLSASSDTTVDFDELVFIGYEYEDRDKVVGSESIIDQDEINYVPIGSFDQILQGRAAGVRVTSASGQPGAGANVTIRGSGSLVNGGQQPLYIVDGVPISSGTFETLNVNDFETVTVLKDAISKSIYGSRAQFGVVQITTKKGKSGRTNISFNTQVGVSSRGRDPFDIMSSQQLLEYQRELGNGPGAGLTDDQIAELAQTNTNWGDLYFRTGTTQSADVAISGGNDKTTFYTSLGYYKQEGILLSSELERYTGRIQVDHKIRDKFKIGIDANIGYSTNVEFNGAGGLFLSNPVLTQFLAVPYQPGFNEDGTIASGTGRNGANTLERILNDIDEEQSLRGIVNAYVEFELMKNITARVTGGFDYETRVFETFTPPNTFAGQSETPGNSGQLTRNYTQGFIGQTSQSLTYSNVFKDVHSVRFSIFNEYVSDDALAFGFQGFGLDPNLPNSVAGVTQSATILPTINGSNTTPDRLWSYFARGVYSYDDKYVFNGTIRRDASSRFSDENRWATFWGAGLAWNMHKENFLATSKVVNNLKLRVSYGENGNRSAIPRNPETLFGSGQYNGINTLVPSQLGNEDRKWEVEKAFDVGVDFGLFSNRVIGVVNLYNRETEDVFLTQDLPATNGVVLAQEINAGTIRNRGIEVELAVDVIRNNNLRWNVFGNIAYNDNEIVDLGQVNEFEQGTSIVRVGLPIGSHYTVSYAGVNPANGRPLYHDINGNLTEVYSDANRVANFGTSEAPFVGGFGTELTYKGFFISTLFTFENDFQRFNNERFFLENVNFANAFNQSTRVLDYWQNPGDITEFPALGTAQQFSSFQIEDSSFVRWRNLQVGYTFGRKSLESLGFVKSIKITGQVVNLATWTKWSGFDPEDANNIATFDYPNPTTYTLGINMNF